MPPLYLGLTRYHHSLLQCFTRYYTYPYVSAIWDISGWYILLRGSNESFGRGSSVNIGSTGRVLMTLFGSLVRHAALLAGAASSDALLAVEILMTASHKPSAASRVGTTEPSVD